MRSFPLGWTRLGLVGVAVTLTTIGVLFVHSTTVGAGTTFPSSAAQAQMLKALFAVGVFVVVSRVDYRLFGRLAYAFYGVVVATLVVLLVAKSSSDGTARWIEFPFFSIQPSELMKVAVIVVLAHYLRFRESYRSVSGLAWPYVLVFAPMGLVALAPDLGTSLMLPPVLLALLFVARARLWPLLVTLLVGVGSLPTAFYLRDLVPMPLHSHQFDRIAVWLQQTDPAVLRTAAGYHLKESLIALGSGGLTGQGWGQGTQNKLGWLPERETDFIFSVIGEEWGFVGTACVLLLYLLLVALCIRVAIRTREPFGRLVATGVGVAFAAQSLQNICMTMGLTPITGLPLPFVSFGGSSLVSSFLALGLVVSVASRPVRVVASKDLDPQDLPRAVGVVERRPAGTILSEWPV